jgi:hypothetical protein
MKPRLYVHIGAAKCGSSAIQAFLGTNRTELLKKNIVVPDEKLRFDGPFSGNQIWFFEYMRQDVEVNKDVVRRRLLALLDKVPDRENAKIIVSAENLSNRHGFHRLFSGLRNDFELRVIFYIRRQDEYLTSAWQQWYVKTHHDFWSWVLYSINRKGQWYKDVEPWLETFGKEAITVRRFARTYLKNADLLQDFAEIVALDNDNIDFNIGERNPSYTDTVTDLAHSIQDVFKDIHDNEFYQMIVEWAGSAAYKKQPSQLLTPQQRHALMDCYRDSNNKMKEHFFPALGDDEELFEPVKMGAVARDQRSNLDPHVAMLARLIYGNYKETVKLRKAVKAIERIMELPGKLTGSKEQ